MDYVKCHLADKYDNITLSETWLTKGDPNDKYTIPGYQMPLRKDRGFNNGTVGYGEVMAWVSDQLACNRRADLECDELEA